MKQAKRFPTKSRMRNEDGMATLEALPLIIIFVVLIAYMFGSFGVIHTAILNSIAARNYAFEIFRHRTNLTYLRDGPGAGRMHYVNIGNRIHAVNHEQGRNMGDGFFPTERRLAMGIATDDASRTTEATHNEAIYGISPQVQNSTIGVNPVWIMSQYGICLNAQCGGGR